MLDATLTLARLGQAPPDAARPISQGIVASLAGNGLEAVLPAP